MYLIKWNYDKLVCTCVRKMILKLNYIIKYAYNAIILGNLELRKIGASRGEGPLWGVDFSFKKELIKNKFKNELW